jgi:hypothetical protein
VVTFFVQLLSDIKKNCLKDFSWILATLSFDKPKTRIMYSPLRPCVKHRFFFTVATIDAKLGVAW